MKSIFFVFLSGCFYLASCATKTIPSDLPHPPKEKKWVLTWQEEFNYNGEPDSLIWSYEIGHIRGNEPQYYQKENVIVENGNLVITGKKETVPNKDFNPNADPTKPDYFKYRYPTAQYTSGSIKTRDKKNFGYGRLDIRAKLPRGAGMWPALWMAGYSTPTITWPANGEIDIMEYIGAKDPTTIYTGLWYMSDIGRKNIKVGGKAIVPDLLTKDYHLYSLIRSDSTVEFLIDDVSNLKVRIDSLSEIGKTAFRKDFLLLINLAMGAEWPGPIDDAILPQKFYIDFVRFYEYK